MRNFWKDFLKDITVNKSRFLSMVFIVMLGCAFLSGIRSTKGDMHLSADAYFDAQKLMDIKVQGTLGLTAEDVEAIGAIDGVEVCVGNTTTDVTYVSGDYSFDLHFVGLVEDVNEVSLLEGRMPQAAGEILMDADFMEIAELSVGDEITVIPGGDTELADILNTDTYTIVGTCRLPYYLDLTRGYTSVGDGRLDAYVVALPEAFASEVYTEVYVRVAGALEEAAYSEGYYALTDPVTDAIEAMADRIIRVRNGRVGSMEINENPVSIDTIEW